jgi:hypothetical protein
MVEAMSNPFERGPFLQVAALCEKVLYEHDGVVSLIRVIDTIAHTERGPDAPEEMAEVRSPLVLLVSLKTGVAVDLFVALARQRGEEQRAGQSHRSGPVTSALLWGAPRHVPALR